MSNIITATFGEGETSVVTAPKYMYAKGQILKFEGIDLPNAYRVQFANSKNEDAKAQLGTSDGVIIPDVYFTTGKNIYAWVMLQTGETDVEIEYDVKIPILETSEPEDETPTQEQMTIINQMMNGLSDAIDALNTATSQFGEALESIDNLQFRINEIGELIQQTGRSDE